MKFSLGLTFIPVEHYVPLAELCEECGWDSVNVGDGLFFYEKISVEYPYTDTGERYWTGETPFMDPWVAIPAMAMRTQRIRFWTNVIKLPIRNPLLVAKTVASAAAITNDRFAFGVGLSPWPEDYEICKEDWKNRGPRCEEMIDIIRTAFKGEMFDYHGKYYNIPRLQLCPVPSQPLPIYIGGTADVVLKRAARIADGFVSPNTTGAEVLRFVSRVEQYRTEYGREKLPFDMISVAVDTYDIDGHKRLEDKGVTEAVVTPWYFYRGNSESDLEFKKDAVKRFADNVIAKM